MPADPEKPKDPGALTIPNLDNQPKGEFEADLAWEVAISSTMVIHKMIRHVFPDADVSKMLENSRYSARRFRAGDLTRSQDVLAALMEMLQTAGTELMSMGFDKIKKDPELGLAMMSEARLMTSAYTHSLNALRKTVFRPKRDTRPRARGKPPKTEGDG